MILKMEKLSAFGLLNEKDAVLQALMRENCVQIKSPETLEGYEELREMTGSCESDVYTLEQKLSRYTAALNSMSLYTAKSGMFAQRPRVLYDELENSEMQSKAEQLCGGIEAVTTDISELRGAKNKDQFLKASLEPWVGNDLPLELSETKTTVVLRCVLPAKTDREQLRAAMAQRAPESYLSEVSADREQMYLLIICHKAQQDALWDVLKEYGASRTTFSGVTGTAADNVAACERRCTEADGAVEKLEGQLRSLGQDVYPLKYASDVLAVQIQRGRVNNDLLATREAFCFTAWVPETTRDAVVKILDQYSCYYEFQEPDDDEEPPILLQNGPMATPYESITSMYSLPAYRGFDPNNFVMVFYFIFFGMMLSDAGIGLILFIGGLVMLKKADLKESARRLVKVITWGGFSAVLWGAVFGSWFGDLPQVIGSYFFGKEITVPQLIDPLEDAVVVMALSMALGFIHILFGMGIKAYMLVKRGHPWEALFDVGFWMMTMIGLALMLSAGILLDSTSMLFTVGVVLAVAGAIGLVLTQGRAKKNPIMKLVGGISSLYDITGYFSDVLSYSRILALGLATGVIAQVVNIMGTLGANRFVGFFVFILVFAVGTALNLGINTLGSYVHTARLQYVEFFGKFYEAGGRPFRPFSAETKYIVVTNKEEQ